MTTINRNGKCMGNIFNGTRKCTNDGTIKISMYKRGGNNACLCPECARETYNYFTKNKRFFGEPKKNAFTFSIELETCGAVAPLVGYDNRGANLKGRLELSEAGFIPTDDCTVDIEFKSPIYNGLNAPIKQLITIDRLISENHVSINDCCGTHNHVGHSAYINATTMQYVRRFANSLFVPLSEELESNPETTKRFYGRFFGDWAKRITMYSGATEHSNFINLQHNDTIEFRLPRFRNASQYQNVMRCNKDMTACIIENFIKHFNDKGTGDGATETAYRKHKAQVTAQKLVRIYRKYAELD